MDCLKQQKFIKKVEIIELEIQLWKIQERGENDMKVTKKEIKTFDKERQK